MNDFIRTAASRPIEKQSETYHHTFGGELDPPVIPPGGSARCHLLYTIDTEDPLFPVRIQGIRYLPLIYCQQYNAAAISYRVEMDGIKVDYIESLEWWDDFPYKDYPRSFPRRSISLEPVDQNDLHQAEIADVDPLDFVSRFGGWHWLCQGIPTVDCKNPICGKGKMNVFGVIFNSPVAGVRLWDPDDDRSDVEIIYQICDQCSSIHVCNRCS